MIQTDRNRIRAFFVGQEGQPECSEIWIMFETGDDGGGKRFIINSTEARGLGEKLIRAADAVEGKQPSEEVRRDQTELVTSQLTTD